MSMPLSLKIRTILSATASGTGNFYETDWHLKPAEQVRSFGIVKDTNDLIFVQGAFDENGPWFDLVACTVGQVTAAYNISGVWPYIRASKVNSNGLARVVGSI